MLQLAVGDTDSVFFFIICRYIRINWTLRVHH